MVDKSSCSDPAFERRNEVVKDFKEKEKRNYKKDEPDLIWMDSV